MDQMAYLLLHVILPIFVQIAAGFWVQRRFPLNIPTLTKVQFYIFIPAITFTSLYATELGGSLLLDMVLLNLALFALLLVLAWAAVRLFRVPGPKHRAFHNSVCLYNSGNYCIPLIQLIYHTPFSYSVQIIVMLSQSVLTNTFGLLNASAGQQKLGQALKSILLMPMTLAMLAAVGMRVTALPVWPPIWTSLDVIAQGMVPMALITLGAQLANTRFRLAAFDVYLSCLLRLLAGPLLAWGLVSWWDIHGVAAQVLIICSAAPSAVNTVLLAIEFGSDPEFAAQTVFTSTLLSALTVPLVIGLAMQVA